MSAQSTTQRAAAARRDARAHAGPAIRAGAAATDLEGAPLSMRRAVVSAYRHALTFEGRASRSAFWWFALVAAAAATLVAASVAYLWVFTTPSASPVTVLLGLFLAWMPLWLPALTLTARRLRDTGLSAWFLTLLLVPYLGSAIVLALAARPTRVTPKMASA